MRTTRVIVAVAAALGFAPAAFPQTYIVPDGDCGAVTLRATRDSALPKGGLTAELDRVKTAYVFLPKRRVAVKPIAGAHSLEFTVEVPENFVAMAAIDFAPEVSGNETRTEHAKALLFCGPVTPAEDWQRSTDLGLEIYPQGWNGPRPHLKPGDPMRFIAVDKATKKLIADLPMELYQVYRAGAGRIADGVPAQYGGMNFPYPQPGRYLVVATYRRPDLQQPDHWLVDMSTLTFEVK